MYSYLYDNAKSEAIKWGTISEAIIGNFPHFNPLIPSNDHNAYINRLLYRSMLEYSTETEKLESDLVSCNLDNLLYIECSLENNLVWSDGSSITTDDIRATLDVIRETKVNPIIASLLEDTVIETRDNSISFSRTKKDLNILYIFTQAILPKSIVEKLNSENISGKFSEIWAIYSGRFRLININQDETVGVTKLTLWRNENYFNNSLFVDFLILNLYRNEGHFLKNKNSFNIFNDKKNLIWDSIPRLSNNSYTSSQSTSLFLNSETISTKNRQFILSSLNREALINTIGENKVQAALNPFLSNNSIEIPKVSFSLEEYLNKKWYYSKKDILKSQIQASQAEKEQIKKETLISQEAQVQKKDTKLQETLSVVNTPNKEKYNFVFEDNILLSGNVPSDVDAVYINDYQLQGFTAWDSVFYYRLSENYETISKGTNNYKLYFWKGKEKEFIEEFVFIYEENTEILEKIEQDFFGDGEVFTEDTKEDTEKQADANEKQVDKTVVPDSLSNLNSESIQSLDESFYYNKDGEPYKLSLIYAQNDLKQSISADVIAKQIEDIWIKVELRSMTLWDITAWLHANTLKYDMLLLGIDIGALKTGALPYFHPKIENGAYNISNINNFWLNILLDELWKNKLPKDKEDLIIRKIMGVLSKEAILYTIYTPVSHLLVDQNIKDFTLPSYLPDVSFRYYPLISSHLLEKKIINYDDKNFRGFWNFLFKKLINK